MDWSARSGERRREGGTKHTRWSFQVDVEVDVTEGEADRMVTGATLNFWSSLASARPDHVILAV